MTTHDAFLRSIIETPDDDAPRLIYADWLEDNGDSARAEFIRVQCRLALLEEDDPARLDLLKREYELHADHWGEWAAPLIGKVWRWRFRPGFVEQMKLSAGQFVKEAKWLFDFAPIREVEIKYPEGDEYTALLASKHLRRVSILNLDHATLKDDGVARLADSPNVRGLTHLSLLFNEFGETGLHALADSPHLRGLRSIAIDEFKSKHELAAFAEVCRMPGLDRLDWRGKLGLDGIRILLDSGLTRRLAALHLRETKIGREGMRLLAESSAFEKLTDLSITSDEGIGCEGVEALARSAHMRRLTSLTLEVVGAGDAGAVALSCCPRGSLRRLCLGYNKIGPTGATMLAGSPLLETVTRLALPCNPIGNTGIKALARSPHLAELRSLDVRKCEGTHHGAKALLSSPMLDRLSFLDLSDNALGPKTIDALSGRLGERLYFEARDEHVSADECFRRVLAHPPRCVRGLRPTPDTDLIRRFPRQRLPRNEYPCVAFELTHPDPERTVLLGYADTRGYDIFFSPWAIRWEPSGEQREFFHADLHGKSGEGDFNCTILGEGKRKPWKCGHKGCRDHRFVVTFLYRLEYPPTRHRDYHLPFADQFYHIDLDVYCPTEDRMIELASFECK